MTEIAVVFKRGPHSTCSGRGNASELGQNALVIRVQADEGGDDPLRIQGARQREQRCATVTMDFGYGHAFTRRAPRPTSV